MRLEATGMDYRVLGWETGCLDCPGGGGRTVSQPHRALTQPCVSLADQEHGLLQARGEWGEGWGQLLGGTSCQAPQHLPCTWPQIEYCRKAMARTRVKSSICLEG